MRSLKFSLILLIACVFSLAVVSALTDVAYIYKSQANVDQKILYILDAKGLSYELVPSKDLPLQTNQYRSVLIGDERFDESSLPKNLPVILINRYHSHYYRITDVDGVSQLTSGSPLKVTVNGETKKVYTSAKNSRGRPISYYFIDKTNAAPAMVSKANTYATGSGDDFGYVVAYASKGDILNLGYTLPENLCYFGISEADFWTPYTEILFSNCVSHVVPLSDTEQNNSEDENPTNSTGGGNGGNNSTNNETQITCTSNSECNDNNPLTEDICLSPGLTESSCSNTEIENPLFSSINSSSTETTITIFFDLSNPSASTEIQVLLNSNPHSSINPNSTNYTFTNLSAGTEYEIALLVLPNNESETLMISTQSPQPENSNDNTNQNSGSSGGSNNIQGGGGSTICITQWSCTEWSPCSSGIQTRSCSYPENYCEPVSTAPAITQTCIEELSLETQASSNPEENPDLPEESSSRNRITGAVIGAFSQQSTYWIIAFLLVVIALYVYVNTKNSTASSSTTKKK